MGANAYDGHRLVVCLRGRRLRLHSDFVLPQHDVIKTPGSIPGFFIKTTKTPVGVSGSLAVMIAAHDDVERVALVQIHQAVFAGNSA